MRYRPVLLLLAMFLMFSSESCGRSKAPVEKKAEQTVVAPVVAGQFYPADGAVLDAMVGKFLNDAKPSPVAGHIFGLASPHAGYQFSGPVAGSAFKLIEGRKYSTVVVLAPSHRVGFEGVALTTKDVYETPLGRIPLAKELAQKLISEFAWAKDDPRPYSVEHSLEVELPFLQKTLSGFRLLPIIVGVCNEGMITELASALNRMLPGDDVLFVASTDLSHYHAYNEAVAKDAKTLKLIEGMDTVRGAELCGELPVETLMEIAKLRDGKARIVKYANSGDTAGDKSRVVGYGAVVFTGEARKGALSDEQKRTLLTLARKTIEAHVLGKPLPSIDDVKDPALTKNGAAFVTITKHGELRGCIGHIIAMEPLIASIRDNAVAASSDDPRFPPVSPSELKDISVEISVLTEPEPLPDPMDVRVGTDGLIIKKDFHQGVLLPQVPTEQGWTRDEYLKGICRKAGMEGNCWKDARLFRFQANVFHE